MPERAIYVVNPVPLEGAAYPYRVYALCPWGEWQLVTHEDRLITALATAFIMNSEPESDAAA